MPSMALLRHDLRTLWGSWLVRLWLVATALLTFSLLSANWVQFQTAPLIASLLFPYLVFPWFLVAVVLGVSPVSGSQAEALADGFLSRPVTRYEYLLAAWAARVVTVVGVYLVVIVPAVVVAVFANRPVAEDTVTLYGVLGALSVVSLVLTLLVSLGFLLGTLLRQPLLSVVVLIFVWFPINVILNTFSLEELSPISLNQAIPTLLRQPWSQAELVARTPVGDDEAEMVARQAAYVVNFLTGKPAPPPSRKDGFFERDNFEDFSLARVLLGYGIPTLAAVALATFCFCSRDL
jgi:ABC-type transport system involved in multi-copper enzyme maturation permease subunit